ncbi:hypothetical protein G7Y79_00110g101660 [Physcia stellaris]|nr:hypothetical protein G7Y79_00110g101660 [Physcia stellaris]
MRCSVVPLLGLVLAPTFIWASPRPLNAISPHNEEIAESRLESRFFALDPSLDGGNMDGTMIGPGLFKIANTPLSIQLGLGQIVDPEAMFNLLQRHAAPHRRPTRRFGRQPAAAVPGTVLV